MHANNKYQGTYNFKELIVEHPSLKSHVIKNPRGATTIDFSNSESVKELNKALLKKYYQVKYWDVPEGYLIPPIPSRSDYIHYVAELITSSKSTTEATMLDIGTGANLIYPIVAVSAYNWKVVGCDIDLKALDNAQSIIDNNPELAAMCTLRKQREKAHILKGVIDVEDKFDIAVCNPPFHSSAEKAARANNRKRKNLKYKMGTPKLNFAGQSNELWYEGGALAFLKSYISESQAFKSNCKWFTALIANHRIIEPLRKELHRSKAKENIIIEMKHGQKVSRILAWNF